MIIKYKKFFCLLGALLLSTAVGCGNNNDSISTPSSSTFTENSNLIEDTASSSTSETTTESSTENEEEKTIVKYPTVKSVIDSIMQEKKAKTLNAKVLWNEYISQTTKDLNFMDEKFFIDTVSDNLEKSPYISHKIEDIEIIDDNTAIAKYKMTVSGSNGAEEKIDYTDYFIKENDNWKILLLGVTSFDNYISKSEPDEIKATNARVYTCISGIQVDFTISNKTQKNYHLGLKESPVIELTTSEGTYTVTYNNMYNIPKSSDFESSCFFKDAIGTVKSLKIKSLFEVDDKGAPTDKKSDGKTITKKFNSDDIINKSKK